MLYAKIIEWVWSIGGMIVTEVTQIVHHKSHMDLLGIELRPSRLESDD
jgi:hypothetical protein